MNTNTTDCNTDIKNAHDNSYTKEALDGQFYGTDTVVELPEGWEDEETYDERKDVY